MHAAAAAHAAQCSPPRVQLRQGRMTTMRPKQAMFDLSSISVGAYAVQKEEVGLLASKWW
jgi:hypothetical protein